MKINSKEGPVKLFNFIDDLQSFFSFIIFIIFQINFIYLNIKIKIILLEFFGISIFKNGFQKFGKFT